MNDFLEALEKHGPISFLLGLGCLIALGIVCESLVAIVKILKGKNGK